MPEGREHSPNFEKSTSGSKEKIGPSSELEPVKNLLGTFDSHIVTLIRSRGNIQPSTYDAIRAFRRKLAPVYDLLRKKWAEDRKAKLGTDFEAVLELEAEYRGLVEAIDQEMDLNQLKKFASIEGKLASWESECNQHDDKFKLLRRDLQAFFSSPRADQISKNINVKFLTLHNLLISARRKITDQKNANRNSSLTALVEEFRDSEKVYVSALQQVERAVLAGEVMPELIVKCKTLREGVKSVARSVNQQINSLIWKNEENPKAKEQILDCQRTAEQLIRGGYLNLNLTGIIERLELLNAKLSGLKGVDFDLLSHIREFIGLFSELLEKGNIAASAVNLKDQFSEIEFELNSQKR